MINVCFEFVSDATSVNVNRMKERITELEVSCETREFLCSTAIRLKHNLMTSGSLRTHNAQLTPINHNTHYLQCTQIM